MFDPFGINNHINSIMSSMMMDPFMPPGQQRRPGQQQQQQQPNQQGASTSNGGGQLRPFDPFSSMAVSPFDRSHNPFSLMHQMMGNMDNIFRHHHLSDPFSSNVGGNHLFLSRVSAEYNFYLFDILYIERVFAKLTC